MVEDRLTTYWKNKRLLLTGGNGFLGSYIVENLVDTRGMSRSHIMIPNSKDMNLRNWKNCRNAVKEADMVIHLAAKVGGIGFNQKYPGTLFYGNTLMGIQLIEAARLGGVEKFVQIGTVCSYPRCTPVPFKEENLWNGYPEETNAPYGIAKKALLVMAQAYRRQYGMNIIYLIPVNLYGPRDNFSLEASHVIPALIRKFSEAKAKGNKKVIVWGTGKVSREFLYAKDAAEGILAAAEKYDKPDPVNLGTGNNITINCLVNLIAELMEYNGEIVWDTSKPDGQPERCLDTTRAKKEFGFEAKTDLATGLKKTIEWYQNELQKSEKPIKC